MSQRGEFTERLGELPDELFRVPAVQLPASPGVETSRNLRRRGNFSSAFVHVTGDGKRRVLSMNVRRVYLIIYNNDATNALWINLSVPAAVNQCLRIPPGGNWEPWFAPINDVYLVGDVVGQTCVLMEGSDP